MGSICADVLRKMIHAATVLALLTGIASAQFKPGISLTPEDRPLTPEEKEKRKAVDDAYKSAIEKIPDKQKPVDPWGTIRPNPATSPNVKKGQQ
jgi:hypothetical protein